MADLTVNEAAVLAKVSPARIRKALEEGVVQKLRPGRGRRSSAVYVDSSAVLYAAILSRLEFPLPLEKKRQLVRLVKKHGDNRRELERVELAPHLILDASALLGKDVPARAATYERLRDEVIERNPEILGGTPVVKGTRISVYSLLARVEEGESFESIREDYPELDDDLLETAITYARAHPRMGRPGGRPWARS